MKGQRCQSGEGHRGGEQGGNAGSAAKGASAGSLGFPSEDEGWMVPWLPAPKARGGMSGTGNVEAKAVLQGM